MLAQGQLLGSFFGSWYIHRLMKTSPRSASKLITLNAIQSTGSLGIYIVALIYEIRTQN